jgi:hypothetical protein
MRVPGTIAGLAHDPGGARAILPVIELLRERDVPVVAIVSGPAVEIAEREFPGIRLEKMEDDATGVECAEVLARNHCGALVSAAGFYNLIEHQVRVAARSIGIPIVAVLDWWGMYRDRFQRALPGGQLETSLPDQICALDEISRDGLIGDGFPASQIVVTGAVNLESSWKRLQHYSTQADGIREAIGISAGDRCAVFFSEPYIRASDGLPWGGVGGYYLPDGTTTSGYTAHGILREVAAVLAREKPPGEELVLCVKPHPMEHVPSLRAVMSEFEAEGLRMVLVDGLDPVRLCAAGDLFFGMDSIVLVEAALSGRPAFSVKIPTSTELPPAPGSSNPLGFTTPVYDRAALHKQVASWFAGTYHSDAAMPMKLHQGATGRVADLLQECLAAGGR